MQSVHKSLETRSRKICSVPQCSSYCTKDVSLHAFPTDPKLSATWKNILKIGKPLTKYMLVCSLHFIETDFSIATNKRRRLKKKAIPSNKIPKTSSSMKKTVIDRSQRHWLQKGPFNVPGENMNTMEYENISESVSKANILEASTINEPSGSCTSVHTIPAASLSNVFYEEKETQTQFDELFELPQILNSDEKLMHFTGINFIILKTISKCAERTASFNDCIWSNMEARITLVLCKFKLNISFACLAVLFKVSQFLCRSMFYSTVSLLAVSLKPAIYWPSKDEILSNMPKCFENFKSTRVVLDKGSHTMKFLIGITPSGLISFLSAAYGGRASDKAIFNNKNVIDKLDSYDAVMVDKGILIEKECEEKLVKLIRPPFLKKQKQFLKGEAERTADIARARVHVERAIQRIKIFKILREQFNWYLIPYADDIMTIIAAIVNLSSPILADNKIS